MPDPSDIGPRRTVSARMVCLDRPIAYFLVSTIPTNPIALGWKAMHDIVRGASRG